MRISLNQLTSLIAMCAVMLGGCGVVGTTASQPLQSATPLAEPLESVRPETHEPQNVSPVPTAERDGAEAACSSRLASIPIVEVASGEPKVAGAYDLTGDQLTRYFVRTFDQSVDQSNGADWWNQATEHVVMCLYDGDFETFTPGPEGHNTTATRVLVVISQGVAEFWASTLDKASIPAFDFETMGN
jgi:hypothetical protein